MELFILGVAVGVLLFATVEFAAKQLKKWRVKRKYQQYKAWQAELDARHGPWSWDAAFEEPATPKKFRSIQHP